MSTLNFLQTRGDSKKCIADRGEKQGAGPPGITKSVDTYLALSLCSGVQTQIVTGGLRRVRADGGGKHEKGTPVCCSRVCGAGCVVGAGSCSGALRVHCRDRHRRRESRRAWRDRDDHPRRDQSGPRDDDERDRQLYVSQRRSRHVPRRVTLPGFQSFRAQDIAREAEHGGPRRREAERRHDVRNRCWSSADSVLLQTETAAVQTQTTSQQLENLPINGRSFQSVLTLTPGVAQPNYFQTGGINNPARAMRVSVNGAPDSNTVFRLDGVSATNQWIQSLQAYTPAIEAIETVNVVTNSFDAEQGMAGGASVNVQIKSGTNTLHGSAFEYLTHDKMRARNYFLPANLEKTKDNKNVFGGTIGGPIKRDKVFLLREHRVDGAEDDRRTVCQPGVRFGVAVPVAADGGDPGRQLLRHRHGHLRSGDRKRANGTGRVPFAFANCGLTSTTDPRFDACNFIPAGRINQVAKNILAYLPLPHVSRQREQLLRRARLPVGFPQDRHEGHLERQQPPEPERPVQLPAGERAGRRPVWPGRGKSAGARHHARLERQQRRRCRPRTSCRRTSSIDGLFGFTRQHTYQEPPGKGTCWGDEGGHHERVPAPAAARLRHAPRRHPPGPGAPTATASASTTTPPRCSTTSIRSGSG